MISLDFVDPLQMKKDVAEPWFSLIGLGAKTVEGRLNKGAFSGLRPGQVVTWTNAELGFERSMRTKVVAVATYPTFAAYLRAETVKACLPAPGVTTVARGVSVYRRFYSAAAESEHGVLAIRLELA